jgi:hypothetical protein
MSIVPRLNVEDNDDDILKKLFNKNEIEYSDEEYESDDEGGD